MPNVTMYTATGIDTTTDNRWTPANGGQYPANTADYNAMVDITTLDTQLATLDGVYWTSKRLSQESLWDKLYWQRVSRRGSASLT